MRFDRMQTTLRVVLASLLMVVGSRCNYLTDSNSQTEKLNKCYEILALCSLLGSKEEKSSCEATAGACIEGASGVQ